MTFAERGTACSRLANASLTEVTSSYLWAMAMITRAPVGDFSPGPAHLPRLALEVAWLGQALTDNSGRPRHFSMWPTLAVGGWHSALAAPIGMQQHSWPRPAPEQAMVRASRARLGSVLSLDMIHVLNHQAQDGTQLKSISWTGSSEGATTDESADSPGPDFLTGFIPPGSIRPLCTRTSRVLAWCFYS